VEAVSLDEELAAAAAKNPGPRVDAVRMRDWSPQLELLTLIADRQADLVQAIIAVNGGKPPKIKPLPRPKTATDKARDPRLQHEKILSKVMIQQSDGTAVSALDAHRRRPPGLLIP
jgi:hypothetical protein